MDALLLAPLGAAVLLGVSAAALWLQRRRQGRLVGRSTWPQAGVRTDILYFTGENCTICHVAQRPALSRLTAGDSDVAIQEVDIAAEPELARRYRVMALPTTVVLDSSGVITAINVGFATEALLREQVAHARRDAERVALA